MHPTNDTPEATLPVLGWREWVALPELNIPAIKVKVDTGARSSALHTHDYEIFEGENGDRVRFHLHPLRHHPEVEIEGEALIIDYRVVRDSGGHEEKRPFIQTQIQIGPHRWTIDLSLTNRENMKFRMLLGRASISSRFLVDPSRSYGFGTDLPKTYGFRPQD